MLKISLLSKFCLRLQLGFDKFLVRVLIVILVVVVTNENKVNPKFCLRLLLGFDKRLNDGNNNGQAMHGARKPPGPKDISSSYTKILGETNFHAREIPRSG